MRLRHDEQQRESQRASEAAAYQERYVQAKAGQQAGQDAPGDDADQAELGGPQEHRGQLGLAGLVGEPRLLRAEREGGADAHRDLRDQLHREAGGKSLHQEAGRDQEPAGDHAELPARDVGQNPGRELNDEVREFQHRAEQDQLERVLVPRRDPVHHRRRVRDGDEEALSHLDPDIEVLRIDAGAIAGGARPC